MPSAIYVKNYVTLFYNLFYEILCAKLMVMISDAVQVGFNQKHGFLFNISSTLRTFRSFSFV